MNISSDRIDVDDLDKNFNYVLSTEFEKMNDSRNVFAVVNRYNEADEVGRRAINQVFLELTGFQLTTLARIDSDLS